VTNKYENGNIVK